MKVQVKVIGYLIHQAGFGEKEVEIPGPVTADELLTILHIEKSLPKFLTRNGKGIIPSEKLEDGDRVVIAPLYSGG
jgi:sulfur carrier protein ThiS